MSQRTSYRQPGVCPKGEAHKNQRIQYICLEESCQLNRLLCKSCISQSHRKHKVGIIDKLIAPLNRLSMNSYHENSYNDYIFFQEKIQMIEDEWEKLHLMFQKNMEELKSGIILQLTAVMRTFTCEEIDHAYEVLMDGNSDLEVVNEYVRVINFLDKDFLEEVEAVKKFTSFITERVANNINKTTLKIQHILQKMQSSFKGVDFNSYHDYNHEKQDLSAFEKIKDSVKDSVRLEEKEKSHEEPRLKREEEETNSAGRKHSQSLSKRGKDDPPNDQLKSPGPTNSSPQRKGFIRHK